MAIRGLRSRRGFGEMRMLCWTAKRGRGMEYSNEDSLDGHGAVISCEARTRRR